jgi:hypothetical protein
MKSARTLLLLAALGGAGAGQAWSHGGGSEPIERPGPRENPERVEAESKRSRIESLQGKIDKIDEKLENPKLSVKKRAKLEKKLKGLLKEKDELLGRSQTSEEKQP